MTQNDDILTITELSAHLRVHPTTIYRLLRQGRIPGFRVGSAWRFSRTAIEKWEGTAGMIVDNHSNGQRRPSASNSRKGRRKK